MSAQPPPGVGGPAALLDVELRYRPAGTTAREGVLTGVYNVDDLAGVRLMLSHPPWLRNVERVLTRPLASPAAVRLVADVQEGHADDARALLAASGPSDSGWGGEWLSRPASRADGGVRRSLEERVADLERVAAGGHGLAADDLAVRRVVDEAVNRA